MTKLFSALLCLFFTVPSFANLEALSGVWLGPGEGALSSPEEALKPGSIFLDIDARDSRVLVIKAAMALEGATEVSLWLDGTYEVKTRDGRTLLELNDVVVGEVLLTESGPEVYLSYFEIASQGALPVFPALKISVVEQNGSQVASIDYALSSPRGIESEFRAQLSSVAAPRAAAQSSHPGWGFPGMPPPEGWDGGWRLPDMPLPDGWKPGPLPDGWKEGSEVPGHFFPEGWGSQGEAGFPGAWSPGWGFGQGNFKGGFGAPWNPAWGMPYPVLGLIIVPWGGGWNGFGTQWGFGARSPLPGEPPKQSNGIGASSPSPGEPPWNGFGALPGPGLPLPYPGDQSVPIFPWPEQTGQFGASDEVDTGWGFPEHDGGWGFFPGMGFPALGGMWSSPWGFGAPPWAATAPAVGSVTPWAAQNAQYRGAMGSLTCSELLTK